MRILLTGGSGFVGSNLAHVFAAPRRRGRRAVARHARPDRRRRRRCARSAAVAPDAIVHAAILNDPAAMAADRRAAWAAYVGATRHVVDAANAAARARRARLHRLGVRRDPGAGDRGRAAEPGQPVRLPQGRERAGRGRARRARHGRADRRRPGGASRPSGGPAPPGRTASATSSPRWPTRCGAASRSRSGRTSGSTCARRRRSRPTRAS